MGQVDRFTVSLDTELLAAFDRHIAAQGYDNRSEAIRDLIRDLLVADRLRSDDAPVILVLSFICDHGAGDPGGRVRALMESHRELVTGSWHFPLEAQREGMVWVLRGKAAEVQTLAGEVQALRGITHVRPALLPGP